MINKISNKNNWSEKAAYNRPTPKSSSNVKKSSIPRIQSKRSTSSKEYATSENEKKQKNAENDKNCKRMSSAFGRKFSAWNPPSKGVNHSSLLVSHQSYIKDKETKKSFVRPSESKLIYYISEQSKVIRLYF